jgi:hypothetical protein
MTITTGILRKSGIHKPILRHCEIEFQALENKSKWK